MFRKQHLLICTALILLTHASAAAQKKLMCPVPPPSPFKHSGQIVTSFDPASGMRTTLEHPRPLGSDGSLYLSATFIHQDPRRPTKRTMDLILVSASKAQRYHDAHDLAILIDGRPAALVTPARYQSRGGEQGMVMEALRVTLSQEDVNVLAAAHKVTARVNGAEVELTKNHVEALREMATLMGGSSQRWRAE